MTLRVTDLALGKCPYCFVHTTFIPTKKKNIFICDHCEDEVRQHVNCKIHWYKFSEVPMTGNID